MRVRAAYLSGSVPLARGRGGVASLRLAAPRAGVAGERVPRSRGRADPHPPRVSALRKHNPTGTRDARERALGARGCARDAHDAARGLTAAGAAVERGLKRPRGVRHRERAGESRHGRSGSAGKSSGHLTRSRGVQSRAVRSSRSHTCKRVGVRTPRAPVTNCRWVPPRSPRLTRGGGFAPKSPRNRSPAVTGRGFRRCCRTIGPAERNRVCTTR